MWAGQNFLEPLRESATIIPALLRAGDADLSPRFFKPGANGAGSQATPVRILAPTRKRGGMAVFPSITYFSKQTALPPV